MTTTGEEILVPVCWFPIEVCHQLPVPDPDGSVQEGDAVSSLTVTVGSSRGGVRHRKFYAWVDGVDLSDKLVEVLR